jgi:hypothetical protein
MSNEYLQKVMASGIDFKRLVLLPDECNVLMILYMSGSPTGQKNPNCCKVVCKKTMLFARFSSVDGAFPDK